MAGNRRFSPRRFKELALYLVSKHPEGVEETKLRWLLFRCDSEAYRLTGRSITGATYLKGEDGAPIPVHYGKATPDRRLKENR